MRMAKISSSVSALAGAMIMAAPRLASACAMCGLSPGDHAAHAFNTSVLFMLVGPYLTVGAIGGILYLAWRRANQNHDPNEIRK